MNSAALLLLVPMLGVSFGYEPSSDVEVGYDYTVQVEPELLEQMKAGQAAAIETNIPPEVSPIRRIRVVVGTEPLAKKLRPGAISRTTYRPEVDDAGSPSIDLLAQTGPAGGFGRSATGFNGSATRGSSQPTTTTNPPTSSAPPTGNPTTGNQYTGSQYTVPPVTPTATRSTMPPPPTGYDTRSQLNAGFEAAQNGVDNTTNAIRNTLDEMGATGERVIHDTREAVGGLISPPDSRSSMPSNNVQDQFRNTTDSMRNSIDQATAATNSMLSTDRYGNPTSATAGSANSQPVAQPMASSAAPGWTGGNSTNPLQVADRSVLVKPGNTTAATSTHTSDAEREYWDRVERQRREREAALAAAQQTQPTSVGGGGLQFPQQPVVALPGTQPQEAQVRQPDVVPQMVPGGGVNTAGSPEPTLPPEITAASERGGSFTEPFDRSLGGNGGTAGMPAITQTSQTAARANFDGFGDNSQSSGAGDTVVEAEKSTGVPPAVWAWAIAIASALVNAFQWINMVDLRNKYRVALRRSSPNFARSMAA